MRWLPRLLLVVVAAGAVAALVGGTACTRRGLSTPLPPTGSPSPPTNIIYVNPKTGSDTKNNGSSATDAFRTLTKAISVLPSSAPSSPAPSPSSSSYPYSAYPSSTPSPTMYTISLAKGQYSTATGEKFPIVVPIGVTISGVHSNKLGTGAFIDGAGEDKTYERLARVPARSAYAALLIGAGASVTMNNVFAGSKTLSIPASATYNAVDVIGSLSATTSNFSTTASTLTHVNGVVVPSGTLSCVSCIIGGTQYAIEAFALSGSSAPTITLSQNSAGSDALIDGKVAGIASDGSASISASNVSFESGQYAYEDTLKPLQLDLAAGSVDLGGGITASTGDNVLLGQTVSEILVTRSRESVFALDDTWNPLQQGATKHGLYTKLRRFHAGDSGRNVTLDKSATASFVEVGPKGAPSPTPSPTAYPSFYPSPTPSPT